jgi:hypothetical protein
VTSESAAAMRRSAGAITTRLEEIDPALAFDPELEAANDRKVLRPMSLAARRLEQLLEALKADEPRPRTKKQSSPKQASKSGSAPATSPQGGAERDIVPPLAQLKVLRALQEELNLSTSEFARTHPDPTKLNEEEREELKELEKAQRDIAILFSQMAKLFDEHERPKPGEPAPGEKTGGKPEGKP